MIRKMTFGLIAAAAIGAFAFTTPKASSVNYSIDTKASTATWLAKKVTGQHEGGVAISKGNIVSDGKNITGGTFEIDMTSITCTDLTDKEYNGKLIGHLKSDDFFSIEKNPTAKFELTKATLKSGNDYTVTGKLTIKGITNEITFPAMIKMDAKTFVTVAKIMVNRTKYDIKYGSASFFEGIGDKAINDEFELNINVVASAK
ncbi:MAG: YceI family protein [Bacteroidetes bacterium]|nr:YceI family protein [Bacteroidota bacterium]